MEDDARELIGLGVRVLSRFCSVSLKDGGESDIKTLRALAETEEEEHVPDDELARRVIHRALNRTKKAEGAPA
jgi:hypothetical protein